VDRLARIATRTGAGSLTKNFDKRKKGWDESRSKNRPHSQLGSRDSTGGVSRSLEQLSWPRIKKPEKPALRIAVPAPHPVGLGASQTLHMP
jgi:hypothetical protein